MKSLLKYFLIVFLPLFFYLAESANGQGAKDQEVKGQEDQQTNKELWQPYYITPRIDVQHIELKENWQLNYTDEEINDLKNLPTNDWITVKEPTSVQMAWHKAGKLPNPYEHLYAKQFEWMERKVWYYKKSFAIPIVNAMDHIFLAFDGIDYFSRIWLNGELLGYHEGMWGGPMLYIKDKVRAGVNNEIIVEVKSGNYGQWETFNWKEPGKIIKTRTFARGSSHKPFYALGMLKGARIEMVPQIHMERPYLITTSIQGNKVRLKLSTEVFIGTHTLQYQLHPWNETQISNFSNIKLAPVNDTISDQLNLKVDFLDQDKIAFSKSFNVYPLKGRSWLEEAFTLENPKLWYPNGLGAAHLYKVRLTLERNGKPVDRIMFDFGIRNLTQKRSEGIRTNDRWKDWQFVVNDQPFFVKGVNWMPIDPLYDFPAEKYEWLIQCAKKAGIQMIRVWGGGLFETEDFYDACNRHGILVWQDFPKNNNLTPDWPQDVWEAQVVQNVVRLRNHPSLAVWSGGNEFNPYAYENAATMNIMERSIDDFDPGRMWVRTSPDHGSTHLYPDFDPVWYRKKLDLVPYVAETGIHSIPEAKSLYEVVNPEEFKNLGDMYNEDFAKNHPEFTQHFMEYSPSRVPRMLSRASHIDNMSNPSLESISEATQVGAGEFYQVMSDAIQSNYPVTTGLMPWVFKRPWPTVAAIHLLDGFGQPSAPYYFLKRTYEPIHAALLPERMLWAPGEKFPVKVFVAGNYPSKNPGKIEVSILDFQFEEMYKKSESISHTSNALNFEDFIIPANYENKYFFILVSLKDQKGKEISRSTYWPRTLTVMGDPAYRKKYTEQPTEWPILNKGPWLKPEIAKTKTTLSARLLAKNQTSEGYTKCVVEIKNNGNIPSFMTKIDVEGNKRLFVADDNYFWLQPGETKQLEVLINWREKQGSKNYILINSWNAKQSKLKL